MKRSIFVFLGLILLFCNRMQAQEIQVVDAKLGTGVENREIIGADTSFAADTQRVYCWMKISGGEGQQITIRWSYNGEKTDDIILDLKYPTMRTYSYKTIAGRSGSWKAEILDSSGQVLKELNFTVQ